MKPNLLLVLLPFTKALHAAETLVQQILILENSLGLALGKLHLQSSEHFLSIIKKKAQYMFDT
jgi:hypothetical protein